MTEDTIFDLASLTKCLATAVAVMQLYEQGKVAFDDPVQKYLPDFNTTNDPQRTKVTIRMLLTNTSGEGIDVSLRDPWGWPDPTRQRASIARSPRRCSRHPPGSSATPTSITCCSARCSRRSPARTRTTTCSTTCSGRSACTTPGIFRRPRRAARISSGEPRSPGRRTASRRRSAPNGLGAQHFAVHRADCT